MDKLTELSGPFIEGFALGLLLVLLIHGGEKSYIVGNLYQHPKFRPLGWFQMPLVFSILFLAIWFALAVIGFVLPWSNSKMDGLMLFLGSVPGGILAHATWHFYLRGR
jgi:hypothetical protein